MEPLSLPFSAPRPVLHVHGTSLCARLARYFLAREGQWVNARELLTVAGFAAWRSRLAELRFAPWSMKIENRTRRVNGITESHYKFVRE